MAISRIKTVSIDDDAITAGKIVTGAVVADIADDSITGGKFTNDIAINTSGVITTTGDLTVDTSTLKVDSANNRVGVGTASPHTTMEIVTTGAGSVSESLQIRNNSVSSGTGSKIRMINSTDATSDTNSVSITSNRTGDDNFMTVEVENTEQMRITHTGDTTLTNGSLIIGTSGKGIDFSATSDATGKDNELLDDYEEGTFTVLFRDGSGGSGNDSQNFTGQKYTKIGNIVHINIFCQNINTTGMSGSNDMYMHGLPYNPSSTAYGTVWSQGLNIGSNDNLPAFFTATAGGNHGYFSAVKDNDNAYTMDTSEFADDGADIAIQMSYFTG